MISLGKTFTPSRVPIQTVLLAITSKREFRKSATTCSCFLLPIYLKREYASWEFLTNLLCDSLVSYNLRPNSIPQMILIPVTSPIPLISLILSSVISFFDSSNSLILESRLLEIERKFFPFIPFPTRIARSSISERESIPLSIYFSLGSIYLYYAEKMKSI